MNVNYRYSSTFWEQISSRTLKLQILQRHFSRGSNYLKEVVDFDMTSVLPTLWYRWMLFPQIFLKSKFFEKLAWTATFLRYQSKEFSSKIFRDFTPSKLQKEEWSCYTRSRDSHSNIHFWKCISFLKIQIWTLNFLN